MSEPEESLHCEIRKQTHAMNNLAESITRLANSNAMIAQALLEQIEGDGEEQPTSYLDGTSLG